MNKYLISLMLLALVGCGGSEEEAAAPAAAGESPAAPVAPAVPIYDETFAFASNTNCQEVFPGISAKKTANSSAALKIYESSNCSGVLLATVSEATVATYADANAVSYTISGSNALGINLQVVQY